MDEFKKLVLLLIVLLVIGGTIALFRRPPEPTITYYAQIPAASPTRGNQPEPILISDLPANTQVSSGNSSGNLFANFFNLNFDTLQFPTFPGTQTPTSISSPTIYYGQLTGAEIEAELKKAEQQANDIQSKINELEEEQERSEYYGMVRFGRGNPTSNNVSTEYLTLYTPSNITQNISITGWSLYSEYTGARITIPKVENLPIPLASSSEIALVVPPSSTVHITTGYSPLGMSFRTNICTGYFSQSQSFVPNLGAQCPNPVEDMTLKTVSNPNGFTQECIDYASSIGICRSPAQPLPLYLSEQCREFVASRTNYTRCIDVHRNTQDFYNNEWRVYLARSGELWANRDDLIILYDDKGKVVDITSY